MYVKTSNQEEIDMGFYDLTCNLGLHVASLYESQSEYEEIYVGFFSKGNKKGDLQLFCPHETTKEAFLEEYSSKFPEESADLKDPEKFQIMDVKDLYYPTGKFSPWDMDRNLNDLYSRTQKKRTRVIRATAHMSWVKDAGTVNGVEDLMAYESRLNYFIPGKPWISICAYNLNRFSGSEIMNVMRTHPFILSKGTIFENPYYQDPDDWLNENAPQFLPERASRNEIAGKDR